MANGEKEGLVVLKDYIERDDRIGILWRDDRIGILWNMIESHRI